MFTVTVDDEIALEMVNHYRLQEVYAVVEKNRDRLKEWLIWAQNCTPESMKVFIQKQIQMYAQKRSIPCFIIYNGRYVGSVDINLTYSYGLQYGGIGYWLDEKYEKRAIMKRAVSKIVDLSFTYMDIHKAEIRCAVENQNSCNLAKRLGFQFDATLRDHIKVDEKVYDIQVWSLLKSEWEKTNLR